MFWIIILVVVGGLLALGYWIDRKRRRAPLLRDPHGHHGPESQYFNRYGGGGGGTGGDVGGGGGGAG
jgi:hypothetical protein